MLLLLLSSPAILFAKNQNLREVLNAKLTAYEKIGNNTKIIEVVDALLKFNAGDTHLILKKVIALRNIGGWENAETLITSIKDKIRNDPVALIEYGRYLLWKQDYDGAQKKFEAALLLTPNIADAVLGRAYVYVWKGRDKQAESEVDGLLARDEKNVDTLILKAWLLAWREDFRSAIETFDKADALVPNHPEVARGLAQVYAWDGQHEQSVKKYQELLKLQPHNIDALLQLGRELRNSGNYSLAVQALTIAQNLDTSRTDVGQELEVAKKWVAQVDSQLRELKKKIDLQQGNVQDYVMLGKAYDWLGQLEKSAVIYRAAIAKDPNNVELLYGYARVEENLGQLEKARKLYNAILVIKPNFIDAKVALTRITKAYRPSLMFMYSYGLTTMHDFDVDGQLSRTADHGWNVEYGQKITSAYTARFGYTFAMSKEIFNTLGVTGYQITHQTAYMQNEFQPLHNLAIAARADVNVYNSFSDADNFFNLPGLTTKYGGFVLAQAPVGIQNFSLQYAHSYVTTIPEMNAAIIAVDNIVATDDIHLANNLSSIASLTWIRTALTPSWVNIFTLHPRLKIPFFPQTSLEYEWSYEADNSAQSHKGLVGAAFPLFHRMSVQVQYGLKYYSLTDALEHDANGIMIVNVAPWLNLIGQADIQYYQQGLTLTTSASTAFQF